jgi:hypothetical protein
MQVAIVAAIVAIAVGAAALLIAVGGAIWNRASATLVDELLSNRSTLQPSQPASLDSLPEPVARYFRGALPQIPQIDGELGHARSGRLTQVGEFRLDASEESWRPFRATQHVAFDPPGFVWDARIRMAPLISVRVRDAYVGGRGSMRVKLLSLMTLVNEHSKQELSRGALQRYLAEAVWFPTALLPSATLRWEGIDPHNARATLSDSGIEVSATFQFNDNAEIIGVFTERYREVDGNYVLTPWQGRFRNYTSEPDARIPLEGEVAWLLPEGELVYWRGRIVDRALD